MLQALMKSNPGSDYIYVVDTRPKVTPFITRTNGVTRGNTAVVNS